MASIAFFISASVLQSLRPRIPASSTPSPTFLSSCPPPVHCTQRYTPSPDAFKMVLDKGTSAPDFSKTDGDGNQVSLSSFKEKRNVVLYFSNGAGVGCTNQSCSFRDAAEDFANLDAEIIAVSAQRNTNAFKRENRLPFSVIPDPDGELQKLYGVPPTLGLIPGRVTYVIDKQGVVRSVYNSQFSTAEHVKTAADTLKSLP